MERRLIYCSACDGEVEVVLRGGRQGGGPDADYSEAICMDVGRYCTGSACPIAGLAPREMARKVERITRWAGA